MLVSDVHTGYISDAEEVTELSLLFLRSCVLTKGAEETNFESKLL
jgi:hypothetical protein